MYLLANSSLAVMCFLDSNGFFLATLALISSYLIDLLMVSFDIIFPVRVLMSSTNASAVIKGFDSTSFLMNLDSRWLMLVERPILWKSCTIPYFLCFEQLIQWSI